MQHCGKQIFLIAYRLPMACYKAGAVNEASLHQSRDDGCQLHCAVVYSEDMLQRKCMVLFALKVF